MNINDILSETVRRAGSDIYLLPGSPVMVKVSGNMEPLDDEKLMADDVLDLLSAIYQMAGGRDMERLLDDGDDDFSFAAPRTGRFRCSAYKQRGSVAAVMRSVPFNLPDPAALNIPETVLNLYHKRRGMLLVTGPAGSGKSTTLACLIDRINSSMSGHIVTLEDPIEFLHPHKKCIVSQREIALDTRDYATALRAVLRQAPDVILLGEMRDFETIQTAMTAAETGHLLLSTLHTVGAAKTIDRIIDVFPANQQQQVRVQLSMVLQAVVSQQLIPAKDGKLVVAMEIMTVTEAIRNMIREGKVHQLDNAIFAGSAQGMVTMDADIVRLFKAGKITRENALMYAINPDIVAKRI